ADPDLRALPVVILSSRETEPDIEEGFRVGASAYLTKSSAKKDLKKTIEETLHKTALLSGRTVLVVDDSKSIRDLVCERFIHEGFKVKTAANGKEALDLLRSQGHADLILSDLDMPEMNGTELCETLQKDPDLAHIPFVVMSGMGERKTMRRMLQKGALAYLVKPFNLEQVIITAEKLLSDHIHLLLKDKERFLAERNLILSSITSLVRALEARDSYTRGHSDSVAAIATAMGRKMGFSEEERDRIDMAGKLHDIGKIGIRDSVLLYPGKLSKEEFDLIKLHPVIGAKILRPITSLDWVIPCILYHHERMDGKGYPEGLCGDKIPLWARMIAVADTYDALTSDRPYRKGMPREKALEIIKKVRGTQLCPECTDLFLSMAGDKGRRLSLARAQNF
ncbi:MAG: response regulator, partial [Thermodesulfobacteriota bacterium]|nr:response regulator [Thermodesulfobacteriota bacterium]